MPAIINRRVLLKSRPVGEPKPDDFEIVEAPTPQPADGEILCRTIWLSIDPYMRGRMNDVKSYSPPVQIGGHMVGGTVSEVVQSRHPAFQPGDIVLGYGGWQSYHVAKAGAAPGPFGPLKLDPRAAPISTALGVLGMPGMTAYVGLLDFGQPKPGETVVVSAAAWARPGCSRSPRSLRRASRTAARRQGASRTSCLPRFSPCSRPSSARGAFSRPSTTDSR